MGFDPRSALLALLLEVHACKAMRASGLSSVPPGGAVFLSKFCFTYNSSGSAQSGRAGSLDVAIHVPDMLPHQVVQLMVLDDEADSYPGHSSAHDPLSCQAMVKHAKVSRAVNPTLARKRGGHVMRFTIAEKIRPRWWYVALADCSNSGLAAEYTVHAVNDPYGWAREFSTDKRLVLHVVLPLLAAYFFLVILQCRANATLARMASTDKISKAAHPFARLLLVGLLSGLGSSAFAVIQHVLYALTGHAPMILYVAGQITQAGSSFFLASLLLLVSQGKCISHIMTASDGRQACRLIGPFLLACLLLEVWGDYAVSRKYTTDYVYTTPFGCVVVLVDLWLLSIYLRNLVETYTTECDRGDGPFYRTYGVAYGLWFMALPVSAVLSQVLLAPYVWWIVSLSVTRLATLMAYVGLVAGVWPGNERSSFKFLGPVEDLLESCWTPPSRRVHESARLKTTCNGLQLDRFYQEIPDASLPKLLNSKARTDPSCVCSATKS